jgi:hypothetical protein
MHPPETRQAILDRLAEGESLRKSAELAGVAASTVLGWVDSDAQFSEQYAHARTRGYQLLADEIIEISDDSSGDVIDTDNGQKANAEFVARSRLRVDSRKWMLSKMLPKVYGDKLDLSHSGEIGIKRIERVIRHAAD